MNSKIVWIESLGGPLILMEQVALVFWNGDSTSDENQDFDTDYNRVSKIIDYVDVIPIEDKYAEVLGDLPSSTSYLKVDNQRFYYCAGFGPKMMNKCHIF